jgi:16S rRNA (guanine527-N7)-methyltransferase
MLVELYQKHRKAFDCYQYLLLKWNKKINLTAITSAEEIIERHFLDSLALLPALHSWFPNENVSRETFFENRSLLDIGAGAGFPGLPLKIVMSSWQMLLVDSIKKKCDFMKETVRTLDLSGVDISHQTIQPNKPIGRFDLIVTRASFSLSELLKLGTPCLNPGGLLIAYKGLEIEEEIEKAEALLKTLSLKPFEYYAYELPYSRMGHQLLMTQLK